MGKGYTTIVIVSLFTVAGVAQTALLVSMQYTLFPLARLALVYTGLLFPAVTPFNFHWYCGNVPPFVVVDVNVTIVPAHTVVSLAVITIAGVTLVSMVTLTVSLIILGSEDTTLILYPRPGGTIGSNVEMAPPFIPAKVPNIVGVVKLPRLLDNWAVKTLVL